MMRWTTATMIGVLALGCAARQPVVYSSQPNAQVDRAVEECSARADAAQANGTLRRLVREASQKATVAVPAGAAAGAVAGRSAKGALVGAVAGAGLAVAGATIDSFEDDSLYVTYMQLCLDEKGHRVIGWR